MRQARILVCSVLMNAVALLAFPASPPIVRGELGGKLDELMSRLADLGYAGGLLVAVKGEIVVEKSYGLADRERGVKLASDSVFNIGSITKQFTAAAILKLEEAGKLSVNDEITRFFKDVPPDKRSMTLHHLLTHSAGLESDFSPTDYEPTTREEYARRALTSQLLSPPGERYHYSNAGYSLLAAVVEILSGQDYETYLRGNVLKPAGMLDTGYKAPGWAPDRIALGYQDGERWGSILERIAPPDAPYWMLRGNGGLHTTLNDMLRWHEALKTDAVLSKASREKYLKPYVPEGPAARSYYAYGWAVSKTPRGTTLVEHNGGNGIHIAEFQRFLDEDVVIFLTSTVAEMTASSVVPVVDRIVFGDRYSLPPKRVPVAADISRERAGRYRLPGGGSLLVSLRDEELAVEPRGGDAFALLAGTAPADAARLEAVSRRTKAIAGKSFAGDYAPLVEAFGGTVLSEEVREQEQELMNDRKERLGAFKGFSVIGTAPFREDLVVTAVQLDFDKGAVFNRYIWAGDRLRGIRPSPSLNGPRLVAVSATEYETFSLDSPVVVRLVFEDRTLRVTAAGAAVPVVALREQ